jgi:hypothetical protein
VVWPDGRRASVFGEIDVATAERIARSTELVPVARLEEQAEAANQRIGDGPVLVRAPVASGVVEVIGTAEPQALCLTVGEHRRCDLSERLAGLDGRPPPAQLAYASMLVDGRWYLFGVQDGSPVDVAVETGGDSGTTTGTGPPDPSVRPETTTVGTWNVAVLAVPDGFVHATIDFGDRSAGLPRPPF